MIQDDDPRIGLTICPECLEPYCDGDATGAEVCCSLCQEHHDNDAAMMEDAMEHLAADES